MLYDNAQLVNLYLAAYQVTGRADFAAVARDVLRYVEREMTAEGGGFYSATDADSRAPSGHDEEGYFFTWTQQELGAALGDDDAALVMNYYNVTPAGHLDGRSILHRERPDAQVAAQFGLSTEALLARIADARERLYAVRAQRPQPQRDDKILTAWNGLMISAFARAALVLGDEHLAQQARLAASYVLSKLRDAGGRLQHGSSGGVVLGAAYLDDYAFFIEGLLDLHEASSEPRFLAAAFELQTDLDRHFVDQAGGGYFLTADDAEVLLMRDKPIYDGAEPSGNSVELGNLLRLSELSSDPVYRDRAERSLLAFSQSLTRSPTASPRALSALDFWLDRPREIVIVLPASSDSTSAQAQALLTKVRKTFLPNRVLVVTTEGDALSAQARLIPLLTGKAALDGAPTAFVCEQGHCELPTGDAKVFARQLAEVVPLRP